MGLSSKIENLWSEHLGSMKATHHTTDLGEETCPTHQQQYSDGQRSREGLGDHINKPLDAGVDKPAQSE